jgi:hypothetical protein
MLIWFQALVQLKAFLAAVIQTFGEAIHTLLLTMQAAPACCASLM